MATPVAPTVEEVASFIRARTKTQGGNEAGTFNPAAWWEDASGRGTRPTSEQVTLLVDNFLPTYLAIWGDVPDAPTDLGVDAYRNAITRLAALGVAIEVELTYWPEQVATGRSPYQQLLDLFNTRKTELLSLLGLDEDGDGVVDAGGAEGGYPSYGGFPITGIGMESAW